jgi:serine/threonine protein kinase
MCRRASASVSPTGMYELCRGVTPFSPHAPAAKSVPKIDQSGAPDYFWASSSPRDAWPPSARQRGTQWGLHVALPVDEAPQETSLGRYNLIASLGQGGMANVYLAAVGGPGSFNKLLVIKALRSDVQTAPEFVQMFLDEARLSARFNHPNIVQTYEVGEADGVYFIAMEYLDGQTLRAVQRKLIGALPLEEELRVLAETARGLHYAHETRDFSGAPLNVVHRDVSPQNVILTYDGQVKLLDFGIAKAVDSEHLTQVGLIKGKIEYIAPEQARGDRVDRRADIFALGVMAWEAVTRQRFAGGPKLTAVTKLHKRLTGGEPDVLDVQPEAPDKLVKLIRRAIALEPAHRFETAAEFANEIDDFLDSMSLRPTASTLAERLARPFMSERARISSIIEEQLKRLGQRTRSAEIPRIERFDVTLTGAAFTSGSHPRPSDRLPAPTPTLPSRIPQNKLRQLRVPLLVAAGAAVCATALGLVFSPSQPTPEPVQHAVTSDAPPAAIQARQPTRPIAEPASIAFHVDVEPAHARVTLDQVQLPSGPYDARLKQDVEQHYIEASAPGFEATKLAVTFDRDRSLHIVLKPAPIVSMEKARPKPELRREPRAPGESAPASSLSPTSSPEPRGDSAPGAPLVSRRRVGAHIDKTNPYLD